MSTFHAFEDIRAWQNARRLAQRIFAMSARQPFRSDRDLYRQIRRAAVSVMSNIAEGFERGGSREFIHFLFIAKASCGEVRSQVYVAFDSGYISEEELAELIDLGRTVAKQIGALIKYLQGSSLHGPKFRGRE